MGYTTDFSGQIKFNKKLDPKTEKLLIGLNHTRRMKRNVGPEYGIEGEFYINGTGYRGQSDDSNIIDYNHPPQTQPGLWCQWRPTPDGLGLDWDGGEKFNNYIGWLIYIRDRVLNPAGITLESGEIEWQGEEPDDFGKIVAVNNKLQIHIGQAKHREYKPGKEL